MRWVSATCAAGLVLVLTFPVLASGSSDGPGSCQSLAGLRTPGDSETCDSVGSVLSLVVAALAFALVAWGWKAVRERRG